MSCKLKCVVILIKIVQVIKMKVTFGVKCIWSNKKIQPNIRDIRKAHKTVRVRKYRARFLSHQRQLLNNSTMKVKRE